MFKISVIVLLLFISQSVMANSLCSMDCSFNDFFRCNYEKLSAKLSPQCERRKIFDILFEVYSIKFKTIDYEYKCCCSALNEEAENSSCRREKIKYIKNLTQLAMEEYDSFLDDLNFELCDEENSEHKIIRRNKKKYRNELKKLISKNCR